MSPKTTKKGYEPVHQSEDEHAQQAEGLGPSSQGFSAAEAHYVPRTLTKPDTSICKWVLITAVASALLCLAFGGSFLPVWHAENDCSCRSPDVPQYFQTTPELWAGPTPTGQAAFLAQTVAFDPTASYVPNQPLQTAIPISGMGVGDESVFKKMGQYTSYNPSPGFGINEYPLPAGAEIVQVQMLSRHGSRYPTLNANVVKFGQRLKNASETFRTKGALSFLNKWEYKLGGAILVPRGRQELYDSGVLHSYMYGQLYNPNSKIIARTTTQDRMLKSAENFMAGFFGLEWTNNATIEVIIEETNFNNSLAGSNACPNSNKFELGSDAARVWIANYLQNATARLSALVEGYNWTIDDTYAMQSMCPYEMVAYGWSRFCDLFTYEEWLGFDYASDLKFYGNNGFGSPTGRAVGLGWQQEAVARLKHHTLGYSGSNINTTLDSSTVTFPLNQSLYFDFTHDTILISVLSAFGLKQFSGHFPLTNLPEPENHNFTVSHMVSFGSRLDIEIIKTPKPLGAERSYAKEGNETRYVHFLLNQRTVPLGWSIPECDASRVDGWCELGAFFKAQEKMERLARFNEACFGEYEVPDLGEFMKDGAPP